MGPIKKKYSDGDVIFREGDPSSSAFVILSGQVELFKNTPTEDDSGMVRLEILSPGAIVGEMGIFDKSARNTTAQALGSVTLDVIEQDGFLASVKKQPDVALSVIGNLAERLRNSNEMAIRKNGMVVSNQKPKLAKLSVEKAQDGVAGGQLSLWEAILALFNRSKDKRRLFEFRVARLVGDKDGSQTNLLIRALSNHPELRVKAYDEPLDIENAGDQPAVFLQSALATARRWLSMDSADLLIWGEINDVGSVIQMRFSTMGGEADYPGGFLISDRLALPTNFGIEFDQLFYSIAVAAVVPKTEAQKLMIKPLLLSALGSAEQAKQLQPQELLLQDQLTIQVCYGNVTALLGHYMNDLNWLRKAATIYQEALDSVSKDSDYIVWANIQFHLTRVQQVLGERSSDPEILKNATSTFEEILDIFTYNDFPIEWGTIQSRIGNALYRLDVINGEIDLLKNSIEAYQQALKVFSKLTTPLKWSELKNNLAQALQVWGDLARNPKILECAVMACQDALQVRNRLGTPMLWAATQNNMGTALFLLGRLADDAEHLEGAAESFGKALEIYQLYGAARLSRVTDRNMVKAENLLRARLARRVAKVYWKEDQAPRDKSVKLQRDKAFRSEVEHHEPA
jgi:tetratricopeptide (TPR) repeat protein